MRDTRGRSKRSRVNDEVEYSKLNEHVNRMRLRVKEFGIRAWGDDGENATDEQ